MRVSDDRRKQKKWDNPSKHFPRHKKQMLLRASLLLTPAVATVHGYFGFPSATGIVDKQGHLSVTPVYRDGGFTVTPLAPFKAYMHARKVLHDFTADGVLVQEAMGNRFNVFPVRFEDKRTLVLGVMWCTRTGGRPTAIACLREWFAKTHPDIMLTYDGPIDEERSCWECD